MPRPPTNESAASERLERVSLQSRVLKADYRIGSFFSTPRDVDGDPSNGRILLRVGSEATQNKKNTLSVDLLIVSFLFYVTGWKYAVDADRFTHRGRGKGVWIFVTNERTRAAPRDGSRVLVLACAREVTNNTSDD